MSKARKYLSKLRKTTINIDWIKVLVKESVTASKNKDFDLALEKLDCALDESNTVWYIYQQSMYAKDIIREIVNKGLPFKSYLNKLKAAKEKADQGDFNNSIQIINNVLYDMQHKIEYLGFIEESKQESNLELEIKKLINKLDFIAEKKGIYLREIKDDILISTKDKENLMGLQRVEKIHDFLDEIFLKEDFFWENYIVEHINNMLSIKNMRDFSDFELSKNLGNEEILNSFKSSSRIKTEYLDFTSKTLILFYPSVPKDYHVYLDLEVSYLYWKEYSDHDFIVIKNGIKLYEKIIGLDKIILINMIESKIYKDMIWFSNIHKEKELEFLSSSVKNKSYIDWSHDLETLLYWHISKEIECPVYDITLNALCENSETYKKLFENLIS